MQGFIFPFLAAGLLGILLGMIGLFLFQKNRLSTLHQLSQNILTTAQEQADKLLSAAQIQIKEREEQAHYTFKQASEHNQRQISLLEDRIKKREEKADKQIEQYEKKCAELLKKEQALLSAERENLSFKTELENEKKILQKTLEEACGLNSEEAKKALLSLLEEELRQESAKYIAKSKQQAEEQAYESLHNALLIAMQRVSIPCSHESLTCTVTLPNEEMKARIIGREGKNVRAFEKESGVNLIIDETPAVVVLSSFDPLRREIARVALLELVQDGRIHPTRIEEVMNKARSTVDKQIMKWGELAAFEIGAMDLHPELIRLVGSLKLRYSFGQNLLEHSLEVSYLMGAISAELGLNCTIAKRMGLLHDMGKAADHTMEGSHALVGYQLALKYGESERVANGIGCHHSELSPKTIEAHLVSIADSLSAKRAGARVEHIEHYLKRMKDLENLTLSIKGVQKAYVLQSGKEVRAFVSPDKVSEEHALCMAKEIASRIESELRYPGKIKVLVIRESQAIQYAI